MADDDFPIVSDSGALSPAPSLMPAPSLVPAPTASPYGTGDHQPSYDVQPYEAPANASGNVFFGVPLPPGIRPERMQAEYAIIADTFLRDAPKFGIDANIASTIARWFQKSATQPPPNERPAYRYDIDLSSFSPSDRRYAVQLLNLLARVNASPRAVAGAFRWYGMLLQRLQQRAPSSATGGTSASDADYARAEARCDADVEACRVALKQAWGASYVHRLTAVRNHVANLPAPLRAHLENAILDDGMMALNHPDIIMKLYSESVGSPPTNLQDELADIERVMREEPRRYFKDERLQERYRALLRWRNGN